MHKKTIELKKKILRQSFLLFLKKGYEETTTREIAAFCGIARGVLHYHFNRKQDILFELYRDFFSFLFDSIVERFRGEEQAVKIIISDILLYRILLTDPALSRMLVSMMRNRDLTAGKITETARVLNNKSFESGYAQMRFALSIAIGAEVELILQLTEKKINMSLDDLAKWVSGLVLHVVGCSAADVDRYFFRALECAKNFDKRVFAEKMEKNIEWFNRSDLTAFR